MHDGLERRFKFQHSTEFPCLVTVNYRLGHLHLKRAASSRVIEDHPLLAQTNLSWKDR